MIDDSIRGQSVVSEVETSDGEYEPTHYDSDSDSQYSDSGSASPEPSSLPPWDTFDWEAYRYRGPEAEAAKCQDGGRQLQMHHATPSQAAQARLAHDVAHSSSPVRIQVAGEGSIAGPPAAGAFNQVVSYNLYQTGAFWRPNHLQVTLY